MVRKKEIRPYLVTVKQEGGSKDFVVYSDCLAVQNFEPCKATDTTGRDKEYQLKAHGNPVFRCLMSDIVGVLDLQNHDIEHIRFQRAIELERKAKIEL